MTSPPISVETVPVRRAGRWPALLVGLAGVLVGLAIVKPWGGADVGRTDPVAPSPLAVALAPVPASPAALARVPADRRRRRRARRRRAGGVPPGQVACGSSDWRIVTLGSFGRWTVRSWTAITPVEASGAADPSIPVLSLGSSDVVGMGACAPSNGPEGTGRASRIVAAWRQGTETGGRAASRCRAGFRRAGWCRAGFRPIVGIRARESRRRRRTARWWPGGGPVTTAGERRRAGPPVPGDATRAMAGRALRPAARLARRWAGSLDRCRHRHRRDVARPGRHGRFRSERGRGSARGGAASGR